MLLELHISNFAIIKDQSIAFGQGLNVISGESGSGKSLILQAIELILGGRPRTGLIRSGGESFEVQALFSLDNLSKKLWTSLPEIAQDKELAIIRTMTEAGKGRVYINGKIATLSLLQEISSRLISICGQGYSTNLLESKFHLDLLDEFATLTDSLTEFRSIFTELQAVEHQLKQLQTDVEKRNLRRAELEFIFEELNSAGVESAAAQNLEAEIRRLQSGQALTEGVSVIVANLSEEESILARLTRLEAELQSLAKIDPNLEPLQTQLGLARLDLERIGSDLIRYSRTLEIDEDALDKLQTRLSEIKRLERKYRRDLAGLELLRLDVLAELKSMPVEADLDLLSAEQKRLHELAVTAAEKLSKARAKAAERLGKEVTKELAELNMSDAVFKVELSRATLGPDGLDQIKFVISPNKNDPFRPLKEVASGGELSRIMLVLKKVLRDRSGVNVLVFDEVDTGVSGGVARAMGEKLKSLSKFSQVLCITHLPQVASLADHHFLVRKVVGAEAICEVDQLSSNERVEEVARMIAGFKVTDAARTSARELLRY